MEAVIQRVEKEIQDILTSNPQHFLVEIKIKPTNNIKIFIDGDNGVGIDDLVKYNRALYNQLEEAALFPDGDYSLEVSSAGLGEPLKMYRQYVKNINRFVEVTLLDGKKTEGQLLEVAETGIVVEETIGKTRANSGAGRGKKAETVKHTFTFQDIKSTQIQ